ncbi:MAG: c-type cytochrome [Planctomycetota bacterium]
MGECERIVLEPESAVANLPEDSPEYQASLERGKAVLGDKAACYKCHNKDGRADPTKMAEEEKKKMFDDWGFINYPRNLRLGMYRGGRRPVDIFRRIHQGIAGASMPEGGKALKPEEIWDLVNFVRAIPYQPELLPLDEPKKDAHGHGHDEHSKPEGEHGG